MINNFNRLEEKILIISFPFLYFIFNFNQFLIQNFPTYKILFLEFFLTYLYLIISYFIIFVFFIKKNSAKFVVYFKIFNLILIFLVISNFYKYNKELHIVSKILLDIFFILILYLYYKFLTKKLNIIFLFFSLLFLIKIIPNFSKVIEYIDYRNTDKSNYVHQNHQINKQYNNVYHIVLDGFQGNIYPLIELKEYFDKNNFIYYKNYYSKYRDTVFSLKNTFNGNDHSEYKDNATFLASKGWCKLLKEKGIFIEMYSVLNSGEKECADNYISTYNTFRELEANKNKFKNSIIDIDDISIGNFNLILFFNRLIPSSIDEFIRLNISTDENQFLDPLITKVPFLEKKIIINQVDLPVISFFNYLRFLENEINIKEYGTYKFLHLVIPHPPFLFNRKSIKSNKNTNLPKISSVDFLNQYIDQAYFGLRIISEFVEILKKQKKFENSLIIVHADHGYDFVKNNDGSFIKINSDDYSDIESKSNSLLLIKYPSSKINKYNSNLNYQNEFISKLILDNFKIKNDIVLKDEIIFFKNNKNLIIKDNVLNTWND